jgi:hypothetical protein
MGFIMGLAGPCAAGSPLIANIPLSCLFYFTYFYVILFYEVAVDNKGVIATEGLKGSDCNGGIERE